MRRSCAKGRCESRAVATVAVRYQLREVLMRDLIEERDPNLLDLCREHAEKLTAPFGWELRDERRPAELRSLYSPGQPALAGD